MPEVAASAIVLVGTNHRHAPLRVREQLAVRAHGQALVQGLIERPDVLEAVGVTTCNRCELYLVGYRPEAMVEAAIEQLVAASRQPRAAIEEMIYVERDEAAARHLFAVAAGLDSLVPGEAQILAQIREALVSATDAGTTGAVTNRLFTAAVEAGKRVRNETAVGAGGASIASVATDLVRRRLGDLAGVSVLVVGAGKVADLVAAQLLARGAAPVTVANRTRERAEALARKLGRGVRVATLDGLAEAVAEVDVVVASTGSTEPVVLAEHVPPGRRRVIVDLGLPRDVDPAVAAVPGVTLANIDDLEGTVRQNIRVREGELARGHAIVCEEAADFARWVAALRVVPAITSLRALAEDIRAAEVERMDGKWAALTPADRERVDAITRGVVNKLLHRPTVRLKELAAEPQGDDYARLVSELFDLR
jgi:glutamyl-tRNA reductase